MPPPATVAVVVLAAGFGKRFRSASTPKVLHPAAGDPLIGHVLRAASGLGGLGGPERLIVIVGHERDQVASAVTRRYPEAVFVDQAEPRGTGDAVNAARAALEDFDGQVVVLPGDSPLITTATLAALVDDHRKSEATVTLLTARLADPTGYGRIIRDLGGNGLRIVEEADASPDEAAIQEVSTGFWCFERAPLFAALAEVTTDNAQGEYYLPDVVPLLAAKGGRIETLLADRSEVLGVNDRIQLAEAARLLRRRKLDELMASGVTVEDPAVTYVDATVTVGPDTVLRPLTFLEGTTTVGSGCVIGPSARLLDTTVDDGADVSFAVLNSVEVGPGVQVGPFTSLRPGTRLRPGSKAGSFVEMKATTVGEGSKVPHLSYLGDAEIGRGVNVGAGSITCNYDGEMGVKSRTRIGDGVLLGSDTMLVAPVDVGDGAITGAGTVVTKDVEPGDVVVGAPARRIRSRKRKPEGQQTGH